MILKKQYKVGVEIGKGSQGVVYEGLDMKTNQKVAIKRALNRGIRINQCQEGLIMEKLNSHYFPKAHWYGYTRGSYFIIMENVGKSLSDSVKKNSTWSVLQALVLGKFLLKSLRCLHNKGFIYNDIKPSNVTLNSQNKYKLIDMGLVTIFLDQQTKKHLKWQRVRQVHGNIALCSPFAMQKIRTSRRDDVISLSFLLMYLLNGDLPWLQSEIYQQILHQKLEIYQTSFLRNQAELIQSFSQYCVQLDYYQKPDYSYWISQFNYEIRKSRGFLGQIASLFGSIGKTKKQVISQEINEDYSRRQEENLDNKSKFQNKSTNQSTLEANSAIVIDLNSYQELVTERKFVEGFTDEARVRDFVKGQKDEPIRQQSSMLFDNLAILSLADDNDT